VAAVATGYCHVSNFAHLLAWNLDKLVSSVVYPKAEDDPAVANGVVGVPFVPVQSAIVWVNPSESVAE
jgi:hypothetical protein